MSFTLCLKDLHVNRGYNSLLEGLNLTLERGEILYVKGPNGIGKSSFLMTIAGLLFPIKGTIAFQGSSLKGEDFYWLDGRSCMKDDFTVYQNLKFWADIEGQDKQKVFEALTAFEIESLKNEYFKTLSQGQQQRVSLARLLMKPKFLWIADEPFTHLDERGSALLIRAFATQLESGGSIIVTSHQPFAFSRMKTLDMQDYPPSKRAFS